MSYNGFKFGFTNHHQMFNIVREVCAKLKVSSHLTFKANEANSFSFLNQRPIFG